MTLVEARVGDAWVSGRVREGVLASSEVFVDTRPFWVINRRRLNIEQRRLEQSRRGLPEAWGGYSGGSRGPVGKARLGGCAEDLFPGRDFSGERMRGRPIPRARLYILE